MQSMEIPAKAVKAIVAAADPGYRRQKVRIVIAEQVTFYDLNWSGGTRNEYHAVDLETVRTIGDMSRWNAAAPWSNKVEGTTAQIPPGIVVVRTGFFCGKVSMATIYVHPDNAPRMLPAE